MSKMLYWAAVPIIRQERWKWPLVLHFRASDARSHAEKLNELYKRWPQKRFEVKRFVLEHKGVWYDIYEHKTEKREQ